MQAKDIAELLNEPACTHNTKSKSGCARPKPGATAGGCSFDGAQIALLPIADVAHIVHGPIACAGSSWDNRGTRSSGPDAVSHRHDHRPHRTGRDHGARREAPVPCHQAGGRQLLAESGVRLQHLRARADRRRHRVPCARLPPRNAACRCVPVDCAGFYGTKNLGNRIAGDAMFKYVVGTAEPLPVPARSAASRHHRARRQPDRRIQHRGRILERAAAVRRTRPAHPVHPVRRRALPRSADHASRRSQHGGVRQGAAQRGAQTADRITRSRSSKAASTA